MSPLPAARTLLLTAALMAALGIGLGAFGAHGLRGVLSGVQLATFDTATRYLGYHALGLLGIGILMELRDWRGLALSGALLIAGVGIFSGSLYILSLTGARWVAWLTPLGGLTLMAGWLQLARAVFRQASPL
jgi:uncharacterized membrane protein YgdD (TMEM256/DUF423 family)